MTDVKAGKLKAATLIAHGNNDFNVMTKNATQFYDELKKQNIPHQFYFHQGGHGGAPPDYMLNLWFTKYLWGQDNGVENLPKSWVVRETTACPPRQSTLTAEAPADTATLTVASAAPFRVGHTLTIPQTSATGTITNTTRVITNIAGNTLTLATAVSTPGQRSSVARRSASPAARPTRRSTPSGRTRPRATRCSSLSPGGNARGALTPAGATGTEKLVDDAKITATTLMNAATKDARLALRDQPAHAGRPHLRHADGHDQGRLQQAEGEPDRDPRLAAGDRHRHDPHAWLDRPGEPQLGLRDRADHARHVLRLQLPPEGKDAVVAAGRRLGLMILSSDNEFTIRPAAGTEVTVDLAGTSFTLPIVGGSTAFATATGGDEETAPVGGTVPATLALTLGTPASFGAFTPGVAREYTASTTATVISTAGDATLTVADPGTNARATWSTARSPCRSRCRASAS